MLSLIYRQSWPLISCCELRSGLRRVSGSVRFPVREGSEVTGSRHGDLDERSDPESRFGRRRRGFVSSGLSVQIPQVARLSSRLRSAGLKWARSDPPGQFEKPSLQSTKREQAEDGQPTAAAQLNVVGNVPS